jgi:hypothetical protein
MVSLKRSSSSLFAGEFNARGQMSALLPAVSSCPAASITCNKRVGIKPNMARAPSALAAASSSAWSAASTCSAAALPQHAFSPICMTAQAAAEATARTLQSSLRGSSCQCSGEPPRQAPCNNHHVIIGVDSAVNSCLHQGAVCSNSHIVSGSSALCLRDLAHMCLQENGTHKCEQRLVPDKDSHLICRPSCVVGLT